MNLDHNVFSSKANPRSTAMWQPTSQSQKWEPMDWRKMIWNRVWSLSKPVLRPTLGRQRYNGYGPKFGWVDMVYILLLNNMLEIPKMTNNSDCDEKSPQSVQGHWYHYIPVRPSRSHHQLRKLKRPARLCAAASGGGQHSAAQGSRCCVGASPRQLRW